MPTCAVALGAIDGGGLGPLAFHLTNASQIDRFLPHLTRAHHCG